MREDIVAGAVFPDYELTDHTGKRRELSELQGPDPMILVLSRGGYCPKDLRQAEGLVQLHHEMEVGYSRLVSVSTDNMLTTNEYRTGVGAHWTFLSDPGRKVQQDLDIAEYTDPEHNPMIPHVIVLVFRFSWKWRKRSPIKIMERTREKATEALHAGREGRHSEAAFAGEGAHLKAVR